MRVSGLLQQLLARLLRPLCLFFLSFAAKFKLFARQVEAPVVIQATKLKFVAESRNPVYFSKHVASTCNTIFSKFVLIMKMDNCREGVGLGREDINRIQIN